MLSFQSFLRETPHETEHQTPVSVYFSHPFEQPPFDVAELYTQWRDGLYPEHMVSIDLCTLIPTQAFVNNHKVMQHLHNDHDSGAVVRRTGDKYYVIDGHHRLCRAIMRGFTRYDVYLI